MQAMAPNVTYADLRETLALQGGKALVRALRDIQAGKVNAAKIVILARVLITFTG